MGFLRGRRGPVPFFNGLHSDKTLPSPHRTGGEGDTWRRGPERRPLSPSNRGRGVGGERVSFRSHSDKMLPSPHQTGGEGLGVRGFRFVATLTKCFPLPIEQGERGWG